MLMVYNYYHRTALYMGYISFLNQSALLLNFAFIVLCETSSGKLLLTHYCVL